MRISRAAARCRRRQPARRVLARDAGDQPGRIARCRRAGRSAGRRARVPARARRRRGGRAAVRGRLFGAAAEREDADLASLPGRDRRPRHLLRSEASQRARDARHPRADRRASAGRRRGDAGRDPALHEAVLDQQRPLQQPHRAQVRAEVHAAGVCRRREGGRAERRHASRAARGESLDAMLARLQPMFFDPERRSDRHQQDARRRARTSSRPAPTTSTPASRWPI